MNDLDFYLSMAALVAVKASILLVIAFALGLAARRRSASTRHALWVVTFASLLLIPAMAYFSQEISIGIPVLPSPVKTAEVKEPSFAPAPVFPDEVREAPRTTTKSSPSRDWTRIVGWAWALGTALLFARLGLGLLSSRRVLAASEPVLEGDWTNLLEEGRERLGVRRDVDLHRSDRAVLPLTMGVLRPTILLPLDSDGYSLSRRSAVILHELGTCLRSKVNT